MKKCMKIAIKIQRTAASLMLRAGAILIVAVTIATTVITRRR